MAKFSDNAGGEWVVEITYADYLALKRDTALDLDKIDGGERGIATLLQEVVYGDARALVPVMERLLGAQVVKSALSVDQFHERFSPEVAARAGEALFLAVLDFFHPRRAEPIRAKLGEKLKAIDTSTGNLLAALIDRPSGSDAASAPAYAA